MILNTSWAVWLAWLLALFIIFNGALSLVGINPREDALSRRGFLARFHILNGVIQALIGLMIAWYPTRPFGLLLAVLVCLGVGLALIRHRAWRHLLPPIALVVVVLVDAWGLRLI